MARKTPHTIIRQARALLAKGWCQIYRHRRYKGVDRYCASAALSMAATGHDWRTYPQMADIYGRLNALARKADPSIPPDVACPLMHFNDIPGRKQTEVVALFDQAIRETSTDG